MKAIDKNRSTGVLFQAATGMHLEPRITTKLSTPMRIPMPTVCTHTHAHTHTHDHENEHTHSHRRLRPYPLRRLRRLRAQPEGRADGADEVYGRPQRRPTPTSLRNLAKQLQEMGETAAYDQIMLAVSDFEKGNLRLSTVLASMQTRMHKERSRLCALPTVYDRQASSLKNPDPHQRAAHRLQRRHGLSMAWLDRQVVVEGEIVAVDLVGNTTIIRKTQK